MKRELDNMYVFVLEIDRERERGRERRRSLRKKENFIIQSEKEYENEMSEKDGKERK